MRQIKFRAWDKKLNKWNLSVEIDCFGNIQEYKFSGSAFYAKYETDYDECYGSEKGIDRFILCQFTGLLDKNGKEIYEGDIIKTSQGFILIVAFEYGAFILKNKQETYSTLLGWQSDYESNEMDWTDLTDFEVIGNIYESPELLNNE